MVSREKSGKTVLFFLFVCVFKIFKSWQLNLRSWKTGQVRGKSRGNSWNLKSSKEYANPTQVIRASVILYGLWLQTASCSKYDL